MMTTDLSNKILTIGCSYMHPQGGVAQVLNTYSKEIFPVFHCITNSGNGGLLRNLFHAVWAMLEMFFILLLNRNIKIVHIHTASYNSFRRSVVFLKLGKFFKKKIILHIHGAKFHIYYDTYKVFVENNLRLADVVIALSESWKSFFKSKMALNNVVVVPNIVSNPQIVDTTTDDFVHILFLGILDERKGVYDLLATLAEFKVVFQNKIIVHVGGGGDICMFKRTVKELSLENIVKYEGWVSGERKIQLLSMVDIYILPSYNEGLPISILEAMSYGLPILSTPVGGIPEVVEHGVNGYLFAPGDRNGMQKYLSDLIRNKELRQTMGKKSLKKIKPYLPINVEESLESLYLSLL